MTWFQFFVYEIVVWYGSFVLMEHQPSFVIQCQNYPCRTAVVPFNPISGGIRGFILFEKFVVRKWTYDCSLNLLTKMSQFSTLITLTRKPMRKFNVLRTIFRRIWSHNLFFLSWFSFLKSSIHTTDTFFRYWFLYLSS